MTHILVKLDHNTDHTGAVHIHGMTDDDMVAQAWESADNDCRRVTIIQDSSISAEPLGLSDPI